MTDSCAGSVDYLDDIGFPQTDVTLVVEDKKIHVNKAVLSHHSPVFNAMFSGNFKESTSREITLDNKKAKDVVEFLRCFYPNMRQPITEQNVLQILPLAHEYQSPVVDDCEKFMADLCRPGTGLTVTSLLDYIIAAEKYDLQNFLDSAVKFCAHIDFDILNGKTFRRNTCSLPFSVPTSIISIDSQTTFFYDADETKEISSKFLELDLKTRHLIAEKRLQVLEMNYRKKCDNIKTDIDHEIKLL
ncbi:uncharacterized protein LOC134236776 [Saccostrea cucullata]|uniref:uncharacterized protein LOC134236776 n=1 Tax=Saccostrea cuccullata TaxID=36930 RepID=UPI002ED631BF